MVNYLLPQSALTINASPVINALNRMQQQRNDDRQFQQNQDRYAQETAWRQSQASTAEANNLRDYNMRARSLDADQAYRNAQLGMQQKRFGLDEKQFVTQQEERTLALKKQRLTRAAGVAQLVATETDPAKQSAMWQQFVSVHPRVTEDLPPQLRGDPVMGARFIIAQALDPSTGVLSKQPIYGTDASGKPVIMQLSPGGQAVTTQLPSGVTPSTGVDRVDLGTSWGFFDKRSGEFVGRVQKDIAGTESAKETGRAQGESRVKLSMVENEAKRVNEYIDKVLTHPAFERSTSVISGYQPSITSSARDFDAIVGQIQGKAFVAAFERLKGAGAITETEGAKAGQALARLQQTSVGSENYRAALMDFKQEMNDLVGLVRQRASGGSAAPASAPSSASPENDPLNIRAKRQ